MIWRLDWIWNLCSGFANTTAQVATTGHIVMPFTQSYVALGIFMPFFRKQYHCRNPPGSVSSIFKNSNSRRKLGCNTTWKNAVCV